MRYAIGSYEAMNCQPSLHPKDDEPCREDPDKWPNWLLERFEPPTTDNDNEPDETE